MSPSRYTAQIEGIRDLAPNVREFLLRFVHPSPGPFRFLPGQSIAVEICSADTTEPTLRYYSIASPPSESTTLTLLLSLTEQDADSSHLFRQSVGTTVQLQGPYGTFHLHPSNGRGVLFVATGTGIAPFRSMLHTLCEHPPSGPVTLFWGLRSDRDLYYQEELQAMADQHTGFSYVITLSRAPTHWLGASGRVTELVSSLASVEDLAIYVCGHHMMVNEVADIVRKKGHCPIYQEEFLKSP